MIFNPDVPDAQAQNYIGWSKPIEQPKSDESAKYRLSGLGTAIGDGATIANKFFEDAVVKPTVRNAIETEQSAFNSALESVDQMRKDKLAQAAGAPSQDPSFIGPPVPPPLPTGLQNGLNRIQTINAANGDGKLNENDYLRNLNSTLKSLRAQFPGYVDLVDETQAKASGVANPANAYLKGMIEQINQGSSNLRAEQKDMENFKQARVVDGTHDQAAWQAYQVTGNKDIYYDAISRQTKIKLTNENYMKQLEMAAKQNSVLFEPLAQQAVNDYISGELAKGYATMKLHGGIYDGYTANQVVEKIASGEFEPLNREQADVAGQQFAAYAKIIKDNAVTHFSRPLPNGLNVQGVMGDKFEKQIDLALSPVQSFAGMMTSKEGLLASEQNKRIAESKVETMHKDLLNDQTIGGDIAVSEAVAKALGPAAGAFQLETLNSKMHQGLKSVAEARRNELVSGAHRDGDPPPSIQGLYEEFKKNGIADKDPQFLKTMLDTIKYAGKKDVKPEAKSALIQSFFSPLNDEFLSNKNFKSEELNPDGSVKKAGKTTVWNTLTDHKITDEVFKSGDQAMIQTYVRGVERGFSAHVLKDSIQNLKDLQLAPGMSIHWNTDGPVPQVDVVDVRGRSVLDPKFRIANTGVGLPPNIRDSILLLNRSLPTLAYMEDKAGRPVSAAMLSFFANNGVQITKDDKGIVNGIASAIATEAYKGAGVGDMQKKTSEALKAIPSKAKEAADYAFKQFVPDLLSGAPGFNARTFNDKAHYNNRTP